MEINNQEIVLLVQNPTHLEEIVIEGMCLGMEAYAQIQWYSTQIPLLIDYHRPSSSNTPMWNYPMTSPFDHLNQTMGLLPFYPPHNAETIYASWFKHMSSFAPPHLSMSPTST